MSEYAGVVVDLNAQNVDKLFDYRVPEGMTLCPGHRVLVPFGGRNIEGYVIRVSEETDVPADKLKDVIRPLDDSPLIPPDLMALADWMRAKCHCTAASTLRLMIPARLRGGHVREKTVDVARLTVSGDAFDEALAALSRAPKQAQMLELLKDGPKPVPVLSALIDGARPALTALVKKGWAEIEKRETLRRPYDAPPTRDAQDPELTGAQQSAAQEIIRAMEGGGGRFLLAGVTGSGKTEVYIRAIRRALEMGKTAIVLVPEIALTPQMTDWFRARFGDDAAVLHSRLSDGERYDEWRRLRRGEARVAIGARSAVFAPLANLGLIVVDEEHEHTYQSDSRPRYDAREVAAFRCGLTGGALVLGSATPSISSFMRVMPGVRPENKLTLLELDERVFGRPMPEVDVVDMRLELEKGNRSIFSASLQKALGACLEKGEQAMLLINRRGYSSFVSCRACGKSIKCAACDVAMTYHQTDGLLHCHYCGAVRTPPKTCPECGSGFIKFFGVGTQKVEETVATLFSQARVLRMDADTTREKDAHEKILSAFQRGEADVLVGTQMIAKGLDFPNVTLVGVVAADMTLNMPDYRSAERAFQLITQVAGRAGRAQKPGKVVVQTYEPEHYAVQLAAKQDYRAFFRQEAVYRKRSLYPPFTMLARILVSGKDAGHVEQAAEALFEALARFVKEKALEESVSHMRALEAPIGMLRGETRWQVFVKLFARGRTDAIVSEMERLAGEDIQGVRLDVEVNPSNMY